MTLQKKDCFFIVIPTSCPKTQFGTAVSVHNYEFLSLIPIKDEMKQVYNILRPGGYFIFTFSDCEIEAQLDLLVWHGGYYHTIQNLLMISLVEMLGFEIVKTDVWREVQSYMVVKNLEIPNTKETALYKLLIKLLQRN